MFPGSLTACFGGGIRRSVFGTENGLTKAPLVFVDDQIETFVEWHHVRHGRIADVTGVLWLGGRVVRFSGGSPWKIR